MGTNDIPVSDTDQAETLEESYGSPERSFATPWLGCYLGFFRIYISVVRPKSQQPRYYVPLSNRQTNTIFKAVADQVELLKEQLR